MMWETTQDIYDKKQRLTKHIIEK